MAKLRMFTVGLILPGEEFEYIPFESDRTLLDADIVLFAPTLGHYEDRTIKYGLLPVVTSESAVKLKQYLVHWRTEIIAALRTGGIVVVYLKRPEACCHGQTHDFIRMSSYDAIPGIGEPVARSGTTIRLEAGAKHFSDYWEECARYSYYEAEIESRTKGLHVLLKSRAGDRALGGSIFTDSGVMFFMPPLRFPHEFTSLDKHGDEYWTDEAIQFGRRLAKGLARMATNLRHTAQASHPPEWASGSDYRLSEEIRLETRISECTAAIAQMESRKADAEAQLREAGSLRRLLYEQGRPLEDSILEAMKLLGFDAQKHSDGESEFDAVLVSPEGRCVGEAEGKDKKPINIDKFSQLERNIHEDFARDEVSEPAKGLLFGNAYRLSPPDKRATFFTEKCISAAERVGVALVRTTDLFAPARYLKENPCDTSYAKRCREAIFETKGDIVIFPEPPLAWGDSNTGVSNIDAMLPKETAGL